MWVETRDSESTHRQTFTSRDIFLFASQFSTSNLVTKLFAQSAVRERKMRIVYRRKENLS